MVDSLEGIVKQFFSGADASTAVNALRSGVFNGLSGKSVASALRQSGLHFANEKFNAMWRQASLSINPEGFYAKISKTRLLGKTYGTLGYEFQQYNYLYQVKINAAFQEFGGSFEFNITVPYSRPLTQKDIFELVQRDLQNRSFGPGSDYGTLSKIIGISLEQTLVRPAIFNSI